MWIYKSPLNYVGFPGGVSGKGPTCQCRKQEAQVWTLGQEDPLKEGVATHPSILAWRISPWDCKELDTTEVSEQALNCTLKIIYNFRFL